LPETWWEFAVLHAVMLYNRTPIKRLDWKSPYELLKEVKPDVSNIRVFGCGAYVYLLPEVRKNKLSAKAELMIFIGFTDGMKGYKFMRLPNNVIFHGSTAVFDETMFPKCDKARAKTPRHTVVGDNAPENWNNGHDEHELEAPNGSMPDDYDEPRNEVPVPEEHGQVPNTPLPKKEAADERIPGPEPSKRSPSTPAPAKYRQPPDIYNRPGKPRIDRDLYGKAKERVGERYGTRWYRARVPDSDDRHKRWDQEFSDVQRERSQQDRI
jgi:hypothetical protein